MKTQIVHVIAQKLFSTPHVKYSHYWTTGPDFLRPNTLTFYVTILYLWLTINSILIGSSMAMFSL